MAARKSLGVALAALMAVAGAPAARAAPVEAYGRLPDLEDMSISPDGTRLAFDGVVSNDRIISVVGIADKAPSLTLKIGKAKLRALSWIDDGHLLIITSTTADAPFGLIGPRSEFAFAFVYDLAARKLTPLQPPVNGPQALNTVFDLPFVRVADGRTQVFFVGQTFSGGGGLFTLFSYDPASRITHVVDDGRHGTRDYMVDRTGQEVAENLWSDGQWRVRVKVAGAWRILPASSHPDGPPAMMGLGPLGEAVLFHGNIEGKGGWHALSLADGSWKPVNYAADALINDDQTGLALGLRRESGADHYLFRFFDPELQKTWDAILRGFGAQQVDFVSISRDHKKVVVKVFGQQNGAAYMLVDMNTGHADLIGDVYADIPPEQVADTRAVAYTAGDGLRIPAYLTLPKGHAAKNLPLVVLVHGGPEARDYLEFDWMAQALASRGYAVLQPEYRGSGGLSNDLLRAGYGQWGRKMQTDLSDGVRFLAGQGVIDAKRVCIAGASYGGYAALAGVTLDTGIYRCAVDVSGPADLKQMVQYAAGRSPAKRSTIAYWDRYMQAEAQKDPTYAEISPIKHIDRVTAPLLIIHGRDDTVVPFQQSQWMVDAMKAAGKPVEFLPLAGEDHWLSRSETRQQMLTAMVRFIETHNPADVPAPDAENR
jgi:dipeptidyl aminopeptidase/acylaminoacyl peptidase